MNFRKSSLCTTIIAVLIGFLLGTSVPICSISKFQFTSRLFWYEGERNSSLAKYISHDNNNSTDKFKIYVESNPKGAERLPPEIVVSESDFYQHTLWGNPDTDLPFKPKYLVTLTVGWKQKDNINAAVQKFSANFTILLFHYDGRVNEWDEFEWSKRAIHISTIKQAKWWYAKRFLHPDIVAPYEYIFIWDEDLGVDHFDAEEYIKLVKKYGLEISQPGLESNKGFGYTITKKINDSEVHKAIKEDRKCRDPSQPPCAEFVEIAAPVFSRDAWRCVWHTIQNDLIHGWGLDFTLRKCVEPAREKMGIVDSQWVFHMSITTLKDQGTGTLGSGIENRWHLELGRYMERWHKAERNYYKMNGLIPMNSTDKFTVFP